MVELADLAPGEGREVSVGGRPVALFRTAAGEFHAIHGRCPHAGGPLAEGLLSGSHVTCPLHAWRVDLRSGEACSPAGNADAIPAYRVRAQDGALWLDVASWQGPRRA